MRNRALGVAAIAVVMLAVGSAQATLVTTYYGDDDGFGVGLTSGNMNPDVSHAGLGEAPYTDVRLIGGGFAFPAFTPTGGFSLFTIPTGEDILSATLTMRAGAWVTTNPVGGPNSIVLDGMTVPASFIAQFTQTAQAIEIHSISLDASFFPLLADGSVSLNGTNLTEGSGDGSFQIDFLRLDIETTTSAVPEPMTMFAIGMGLTGLGGYVRKRRLARA